ncbi:MAG: MGMT family protein [Patescibacteria group bacterium]
MTKKTKKSFSDRVYEVVKKILKGETMTYKEVAIAIGSSCSFRAVGNALNKNKNPMVPCHRIIRTDGKTGGYRSGKSLKKSILKKEGAI